MKTTRSAVTRVIALLLIFLTEVKGKRKSRDVSDNNVDNDVCVQLIERIFYGRVRADSPPDITGEWTSERCEVRPGPEYVLRKYRFESTSHFSAHIFYYGDADCSNPLYVIRAEGTYTLLHESLIVPGGTEVDYELEKVLVMMYTDNIARDLGRRINKTCPDLNLEWKPYKRYEIYTYTDMYDSAMEFDGEEEEEETTSFLDRDCTSGLYFSFHELQLMRLEERHHGHSHVRMLYLGDIHTDRRERQIYRPTSYQDPLFPAQRQGCSVCKALVNSDDYYPPGLSLNKIPEVDLAGEWFSERCETRPNGMFLTRRLLFEKDGRSWEGFYYHYVDALCREPSFTIHSMGNYAPGDLSNEVGRSYNFDFKVLQLKITPGDRMMAESLNVDDRCGVKGTWRIGEEQDVTGTNGCHLMGISLPHVEYEIVRLEKDHHKSLLYLGQRPSDGSHPSTPQKRPTSFQSPLLKCSKPITVTPPTVRKYVLRTSAAPSCYFPSLLLQITALFCSALIYLWN